MNRSTSLFIPETLYATLGRHLFPGDEDEHAAVIAAGFVTDGSQIRLLARELFIAEEGRDYKYSNRGYKALQAPFIHRCVTYCRDQRLVYLAIHNHGGYGHVEFSAIDYESHARGYPALLDIAAGLPVGALVFAQAAIELDLWLPDGRHSALKEARVIGNHIERLYSHSHSDLSGNSLDSAAHYDRQVRIFGSSGQHLLRSAKIAIVGLGGIGSLVNEYLARLGVGELTLIDPDRLDTSNFSRVVGATAEDLPNATGKLGTLKVEIAARVACDAQPHISTVLIQDDFSLESIARQVVNCDYVFLAADTMRARLVFNAIVNQYFIPGVQLGSKITANRETGALEAAYSVVRKVTPGNGCLLCNQLIDSTKLAGEWKTNEERLDQQYGTNVPNPSVITMNAVAAAYAVNEFLFYFTGLNHPGQRIPYLRFDHLNGAPKFEEPRRGQTCSECSLTPRSRFGMGDAHQLPCAG
jgi:molybdopterin/thiamine biosynthesis adenylyltransferase